MPRDASTLGSTSLETRTLGRSGIAVTTLGFGGAPLGAVGPRIDDETVAAIVQAALDGGIRYFDTAPLYGHGLSEKRLGQSLAERPREDFALSTKVGRLLVPPGQGERAPFMRGASPSRSPAEGSCMRDTEPVDFRYDYTYDATRASLEASLERLGLDRVDILLCHDIDLWTHGDDQAGVFDAAARGALPALSDLRAEGTIGAFGLGVNNWEVCSRVLADFDVDCFLLAGRFTLLEQEPLDVFLPQCVDCGVSVIIGGPYNSGLLAVDERRRATYDYQPVDDDRWERAQQIRGICSAHGVDIRAAALQYPLRHPAVASVIPGVRSVEEVRTNLALEAAALPEALWDDLADAGLARPIP